MYRGVAKVRDGDSKREELALVEAARHGDRGAFAALFRRWAPAIHGIALARVSPAEADDVVQEVFLAAMERIGTLRDGAAFGAWLCTIARTRAVDLQRGAARHVSEIPERGEADPDRAEAERALAAIRSLPESYRETLVLRLVEGMTGPEIAERTGLTPESVRVNLHRGMKLLREALGVE